MSRLLFILTLPLFLFIGQVGYAQAPTWSKADQQFSKEASQGNSAEVELGQLALTRSQNAEVKEFAQMMIDHHSKANQDLEAVLKQQNQSLVTTPTPKQASTKKKLESVSAAQFDAKYLAVMVDEHRATLKKYEAHLKSNPNSALASYINQTIPVVRRHQEQAEKLAKDLKQPTKRQ